MIFVILDFAIKCGYKYEIEIRRIWGVIGDGVF